MDSKIAIILVNYNGEAYLKECIDSLRGINYDNYEIIVVDNGSTDNSLEILNEYNSGVVLIQAEKNGGFSYGNNIGIKYALENNADYCLLINTDTLVEPDFLLKLLESFDRYENVGIVGPKIMYYPDKERIWFGGGRINWLRFKVIHDHIKELDIGQCNEEKEVEFMTGCAILISKKTIEKVGLLEEDYFMYCEDIDFSMKILDNNLKIIFNPEAVIYHKVSASSGGEDSPFSLYWKNMNTIKVMKKFKNRTNIATYLIGKTMFYLENLIKCVLYKLKGKNEHYEAIVKGIKKNRGTGKSI